MSEKIDDIVGEIDKLNDLDQMRMQNVLALLAVLSAPPEVKLSRDMVYDIISLVVVKMSVESAMVMCGSLLEKHRELDGRVPIETVIAVNGADLSNKAIQYHDRLKLMVGNIGDIIEKSVEEMSNGSGS